MADGERVMTREELVAVNNELRKQIEKYKSSLEELYGKYHAQQHLTERYLQIIEGMASKKD